MVWWVWLWCELYTLAVPVIRFQLSWTTMTTVYQHVGKHRHHKHQNNKNGVHPSSRPPRSSIIYGGTWLPNNNSVEQCCVTPGVLWTALPNTNTQTIPSPLSGICPSVIWFINRPTVLYRLFVDMAVQKVCDKVVCAMKSSMSIIIIIISIIIIMSETA